MYNVFNLMHTVRLIHPSPTLDLFEGVMLLFKILNVNDGMQLAALDPGYVSGLMRLDSAPASLRDPLAIKGMRFLMEYAHFGRLQDVASPVMVKERVMAHRNQRGNGPYHLRPRAAN